MATKTALSPEDNNVTTGQDIANLISKCSDCTNITEGGNYITSFMHLPKLKLPIRSKLAIIVNSEKDYSENVGHWFVLVIYANKTLILCDGLNETEIKSPSVMQVVKSFCSINGLTYTSLNVRCQLQTSKTCGFICLFFVAKASLLSLRSFILLRNTMTRNSIHTNEEFVIKFVRSHYSKS